MAEALRAYTVGSAYASREEHVKGSVAPGLLADLVVLSEDPTAVSPDRSLASRSWPPSSAASSATGPWTRPFSAQCQSRAAARRAPSATSPRDCPRPSPPPGT